jgi:uncharacterized protein (DUF983 family)
VSEPVFPPVSPLRAGLTCRCPRCGRGRLFNGFLTVVPRCGTCDLDLGSADSGDGPAVFVVLILGIFVVGGALAVEMAFTPPLWLHMVVWLPVATAGALALLRPFKGVLIALQFHHQAGQDRHVD